MIGIIAYGSGNVKAIENIYKKLNIKCKIVTSLSDFEAVDRIILPGVGSFDEVIGQINSSGMRGRIDEMVLEGQTPVLGVCVGMQVMAKCSDEGNAEGLGWFDAEVKLFDVKHLHDKPKLPHMGWNIAAPKKSSIIFDSIEKEKGFYFLHSYHFNCFNDQDVLAETYYGYKFASAIHKGKMFGFQFHPEKSHLNGIRLFKNFAELV